MPAKIHKPVHLEESFCLFHERVKYYFVHLIPLYLCNRAVRNNSVYISEFSIISTAKFIY